MRDYRFNLFAKRSANQTIAAAVNDICSERCRIGMTERESNDFRRKVGVYSIPK